MQTEFRLASIFSNHMVLCRGKNIRIFGEAKSGKTVTVSILDHTVSCTAVKGKFTAVLPPVPPGGPYTMTATDGEQTLSFSDILIGDVYFAGGQSNMEMRLDQTENGKRYTAEADHPKIRYCNFPVQLFLDDKTLAQERKTSWRTVRPGTCGEISAVAYHFAVRLQTDIQVPIGIIDCYLGGTSIISWLDEDSLCATSGGKVLFDAYQERIRKQTNEQYEAAFKAQTRAHTLWQRKAEAIKEKNPSAKWDDFIAELGLCPWPPPEGKKDVYRPCGLSETMVKRIAPYTITGFLYYQGESDAMHPHLYRGLMMTLISFWRDLFSTPSLPFLYVQLPMFEQRDEAIENSWALIRQAQESIFLDMRNTGLAVMIDGGAKEDIHPQDKKTVGERLYLQAMKVVYGQTIDGDSPRAVAARPDGDAMIVDISAPLRHSKTPTLFEVAGEDGQYYQANAEIHDTVIRVSASEVAMPRCVRYAWVNYGVVSVFGTNGLPLAPFSLR